MSPAEAPVDVDVLRDEIRKTYADVSSDAAQAFIFPTGRAWAADLGYPQPELCRIPDATVESFAGVANHWTLGRIEPGAVVLDLGGRLAAEAGIRRRFAPTPRTRAADFGQPEPGRVAPTRTVNRGNIRVR